jgi:hypothetical protein
MKCLYQARKVSSNAYVHLKFNFTSVSFWSSSNPLDNWNQTWHEYTLVCYLHNLCFNTDQKSNMSATLKPKGVRWLTIDLTHVNIIIPMYNHLNSIFWQQTKFFWKDNIYYLSMYIHVNNCIDRALVQFLLCPIISNINVKKSS